MAERSGRRRRVLGVVGAGLSVSVALSWSGGCASGDTAQTRRDRERAAAMGLSADAEDPSARDKRAGVGKWKEKDEPAGTRDPMTPERRNLRWD